MIWGHANVGRRVAAVSIAAVVVAFGLLLPTPDAEAAPGASEMKDALADNTRPLESAGLRLNRDVLTAAYQARDFEPVWTAPEMTEAFEAALGNAGREGLDPETFDLSKLKSALAGSSLTPVDRELLLSDRFLAYAQVLAQGAVAPSAIEDDWLLARPGFD